MKTRRGSDTVVGLRIAATASQEYKERVKEIRKVLVSIEHALKGHEARQKEEPADWGYVGDVGHVLGELKDVSNSLGGGDIFPKSKGIVFITER